MEIRTMQSTTSTQTGSTLSPAEQSRADRARNSHITLVGVIGDDFVVDVRGSDETHVVKTSGTDAEMCTCPDHQQRGIKCKHMFACENFSYIDVFDFMD